MVDGRCNVKRPADCCWGHWESQRLSLEPRKLMASGQAKCERVLRVTPIIPSGANFTLGVSKFRFLFVLLTPQKINNKQKHCSLSSRKLVEPLSCMHFPSTRLIPTRDTSINLSSVWRKLGVQFPTILTQQALFFL